MPNMPYCSEILNIRPVKRITGYFLNALWMARFSAKGRKTFQHCSSQSASLAAVECPLWNSNWWFQGITMMETNQTNKQISKLFWESKNKILDTPPSKSSGLQWHLEFLYFSAPSICKPIVFTLLYYQTLSAVGPCDNAAYLHMSSTRKVLTK